MYKSILVFLLFFTFINGYVISIDTFNSGDDKIGDMKERVLEEEDDDEEEEEEEEEMNENDDEETNLFLEFLFIITVDSFNYRFARYPFATNLGVHSFRFCAHEGMDPDITRWGFVHATSQFSYLFDGICGTTNKININILAIHLNIFYQRIFSKNDAFSVISINPGFSIIGKDFLINYFCGLFKLDFVDDVFFSFGFHGQLILPQRIILDIYNLNSIVYSLAFIHGDISINYALRFINIGAGLTFNYYAKTLYIGPFVKLSFWF